MKLKKILAYCVCAVALMGNMAQAENLRIATALSSTSADPQFYLIVPNDELRRYAFESLVDVDESGNPEPQLAQSWRLIDEKTWEFKLRPGVVFHDGSSFDAQDVIYSICRIRANKSAGSFARYVSQVVKTETPDPLTLVVHTRSAYPLLLSEFSLWAIVRAPDGVGAMDVSKEGCGLESYPANNEYDNLSRAIGTGPYAYTSYNVGGTAKFARFDKYWGTKPAWENVTLAPVEESAARTAAFLAGDYDLIQGPSPQAIDRISKDPRYSVAKAPTYDVRYLMFDTAREPSPQITGTNGKNPFKDVRVRKAVDMALNREAIISRVIDGNGVIASNLQGKESFGFNSALKPLPYDVKAARALLAEAGYPNGFGVTLSVQTDTEAARVGQAVAQVLSQVGITVTLESLPTSVFFRKRGAAEYSLFSHTIGARSGEMLTPLRVLLGTPNLKPGFGNINGGGYSNPALDALLTKAEGTMDDAARRKLLEDANRVITEDFAVALLYQRVDNWAFSKKFSYTPSISGYTLAQDVHPAR